VAAEAVRLLAPLGIEAALQAIETRASDAGEPARIFRRPQLLSRVRS
jgi:hypothetical protein